jgi:nucleoside-specific outer membrane channel protein Tsx
LDGIDTKHPSNMAALYLYKFICQAINMALPQIGLLNKSACNCHRMLMSIAALLMGFSTLPAQALDWSDNSIAWRYGDKFREPFNPLEISKNILTLVHVDGYKYGSNYLNISLLVSDSNDPSSATSTSGAKDLFIVYRHTLDIGKISGNVIKFGPVRGAGITAGIDLDNKPDVGYNSKKRMLVLGPTLMMDVPGFLNISLFAAFESNDPSASPGAYNPGYPGHRYYFDTHPILNAIWGIPLGSLPLSFEGFANFIAAKGKDETGKETVSETIIDMQVMYDICATMGCTKNTFRAGFEYWYWNNKFGNSDSTVGALGGNKARTPMIRLEYHF